MCIHVSSLQFTLFSGISHGIALSKVVRTKLDLL
jgi:hypothetical protein